VKARSNGSDPARADGAAQRRERKIDGWILGRGVHSIDREVRDAQVGSDAVSRE
jgi:hypothetical protein